MLFYYCLFFIISLGVIVDIMPYSSKVKHFSFYLMVTSVICIVGGRYWCDDDYVNYVFFFNEVPSFGETNIFQLYQLYLSWQVEFGYLLSCSILKALDLNYQSVFCLCSCLSMIPITSVCRELSFKPMLSFFLFFFMLFTLFFVQMRFGVATGCAFYAIVHLYKREEKRFWIWIVVAILFHTTALIGLLFPLISKFRITRKKGVFILGGAFLFLFIPIRTLFVSVVSYTGLMRYMEYLDSPPSSWFSIIFLMIMLFPFIYWESIFRKKIKYYDMLALMGLCSVIMACMTRELPVLNRFYLLLSSSFCIILPSYLLLFKKNIFTNLFLVFFFLLFAFLKFYPSLSYITDYQFFLLNGLFS